MTIKEIYGAFLKCGCRFTTDSRAVKGGEMFIALKGDRFDGNDYALSARDSGAAYAVVSEGTKAAEARDSRIIVVKDTLETMRQLALMHRRTFRFPVIGLTGTNGKTTTKELLKAVLSQKYRVAATQGNLNNDIGVPTTLLSIDPNMTDIAIIEMGASHPDDINHLIELVEPQWGLITNVGKAHLLGFGDFEGVQRAKGELYDYLLRHDGTAFVNPDDGVLEQMVKSRPGLKTIPYSYPARVIAPGSDCPFLRMEIEGRQLDTQLIGSYNASNVRAALSVGAQFGVSLEQGLSAISQYKPSNSRSQMVKTSFNTLIVDAYNANPSSMSSALDNFASLHAERKVALLGDMRELGADSLKEHICIARKAIAGDYTAYFVGSEFAAALAAITGRKSVDQLDSSLSPRTFATSDELASYLHAHPMCGCTILIKGSRSIQMEKTIAEL